MTSIDARSLAAHVLVALADAQSRGRTARLDELAEDLDVRRTDVRSTVTQLHAEGHVDAYRLRLTMSGLALAATFDGCLLKEPHRAMEMPPPSSLRVA